MQYRKLRREKRREKYSAFKQNQKNIDFPFFEKDFFKVLKMSVEFESGMVGLTLVVGWLYYY